MSKEISARARAFLAGTAPASRLPTSARGGEMIQVLVHCSAHGGATAVEATLAGDILKLGKNVKGAAGPVAAPASYVPAMPLGNFVVDPSGWEGCPICGDGGGTWVCTDPPCGAPLHCKGSRDGLHLCACGKRRRITFVSAGIVPVSGARQSVPLARPSQVRIAGPAQKALPPPPLLLTGKK